MTVRKKGIILFIFDVFIFITTALCVLSFYVGSGAGSGTRCFRFYTVLSNIFMALVCAFRGKIHLGMIKGERQRKRFSEILCLSATASVTLTFLTVVFFLSSFLGLEGSFGGKNLYVHLLNPLFALFGFLFLEEKYDSGRGSFLMASLPTFLYGIIYFIMVVIIGDGNGGWDDFYQFNRGGKWPISMAAMFSVIVLICYVLYRVRKGKNG